jgi:peptidoglycan/LPS O-acetylase OafA/YrhL
LNVVVITVCLNFSGQIFSCLAFFYAGGLAAIVRRSIAGTDYAVVIERVAWSTMAAIPVLIFWLQPQIVDWLFLLAFTPLLLFCLSRNITVSASIQALVEAAGNMTYSSYLLHFPIQLMIASAYAISGNPIPLYSDWFFAIYVTSTLTASYFTYRYYEAPAQALIRKHLLTGRERHALPESEPLRRMR